MAASVWKAPNKKFFKIVQGGKKGVPYKHKAIPHKNKHVHNSKPESTWNQIRVQTFSVSRPEGKYEFSITAKIPMTRKIKEHPKVKSNNPIPAEFPVNEALEVVSITAVAGRFKMPKRHTMEVEMRLAEVLNAGNRAFHMPRLNFDVVIKTGHMITGEWTTTEDSFGAVPVSPQRPKFQF